MRFDMNRAWNEAVRLLRANKELLALLAGIFIFLPSLATYLIVPQTMAMPSDLDTNNPMPQINAYFAEFGPYIIALSVAQYVGLLAMVALFARRRPTVGDAIKNGFAAIVPLLVLQIGITIVMGLIAGLLFGLLSVAGSLGLTLASILIMAAIIYVSARLFPVVGVMIFEKIYNPIKAMIASFRLTKGTGAKLLAFLALLVVAWVVLSTLANLPVALVAALIGNAEIAVFVEATFAALLSAILTTIVAALIVSVYRQLAAGDGPDARESRV